MLEDPYKYFRVEARELLDELTQGALDLERGSPTAAGTARLLRHAHTLKGAARVVKQPQIADDAHALEEALEPFRNSGQPIPHEQLELVLGLLASIERGVAGLALPDDAGEEPASPRDDAVRTVRAEIAEMDVLLEGIGQAHRHLGSLRRGLDGLLAARELADALASELGPRRAGIHRLSRTPAAAAADGAGAADGAAAARAGARAGLAAMELRSAVAACERRLATDVEQIHRELLEVRDAAQRIRLMPARSLFIDLERAARDVAHAQGKRVDFEGRGGEVRLDAHVLAAAQAALQQTVRNAVAHGIESEGERLAAGKPPHGRVTLEVARRSKTAVFACRDDGRGIDLDAVRRVAESKGLLPAEGARLAAEEIIGTLLRGGVSTSGAVTELSGRGIGFDILRDCAARLGGEVSVRTAAGQGTTVELEVPLSLAAFDALAVKAGETAALIPLDAIEKTLRAAAQDIQPGPDGTSITCDGEVLPFVPLAALLRHTEQARAAREAWSVVIVRGEHGAAAIGADGLAEISSVAVRPVPQFLASSPVVSGVWFDLTGAPRLVLDPDALIAEARRSRESAAQGTAEARPPILVVDDSLTTRMLEQSILESAGYSVDLASSAEEALTRVQDSRYMLFLVDVEMPGMDGFTFVERIRADASPLCDTPAILVTSLASPEHRRRGLDAGANSYITKAEFDQGVLLEQIRALTAG